MKRDLFRTLYLDQPLSDDSDLNSGLLHCLEQAVRAEGHEVELSEVLCDKPAINVHGYTYRSEASLRYWLNVAGVQVKEVA